MNGFLQRLKQRKLVQWAIAYVAAAFAMLQGIDIVAQRFGWPEQTMRLVIVAMSVGFFVALVLAWYHGERGAQRITGTELLILALLLGLGGGFLWHFSSGTRASATKILSDRPPITVAAIPQKSIAVLPFENLSDEKQNGYFAAGIQDEILTRLAKIGALKVISRSSTQQYQSKPGNLREIAQQLGVANILEGSVQKAGAAVHVNVQLIKAATDDHLWAESYDRTLDNIFGVEGEIAQTVAEALKAKLTGAEEKALSEKPTNNPAAYDAYLRGTAQGWQLSEGADEAAKKSFEEAVRLDPQFAAAWAALSRTHSKLFFHVEQTPAERASAEKALAEATRLQADLPETQLARAYFQYWVLHDYKGSLEMMRKLRMSWPNNPEVPQAMAFISARLGQWPEALADIGQAVALNPNAIFSRMQAISIAMAMRELDKVLEMSDNALQIWPNHLNFIGFKAYALQACGQLDQAQAVLDKRAPNSAGFNVATGASFYQSWVRNDPGAALKQLDGLGEAGKLNDPLWLVYSGILQEIAGQKTEAQANLIRARDKLVELLNKQPDNPELLGPLAFTFAWLGQREDALQTISRYDSASVGDARISGIGYELKARVFARLGNKGDAIASLEKLLASPSDPILGPPLTPALLRLDPNFTLLRGDPRFDKLVSDVAPKPVK